MSEVVWRGPAGRAFAMPAIVCLCVLGLMTSAGGAAAAAFDVVVKNPDGSSIDLVRPKKSFRFSTGNLHRGALATTNGRPLEIWAHRPEPGGELLVEEVKRGSGDPVTVPLPGMAATLDKGLSDFIEYRIKNSKGAVVAQSLDPLCPNGQASGANFWRESRGGSRSSSAGRIPVVPAWWGSLYPCGEEQAESLVWLFGRNNPLFYYGGDSIPLPDGEYVYEAVINPDGVLPEKTLANNRFRQRFSLVSDRALWRETVYGDPDRNSGGGRIAAYRGGARSSAQPLVRPPTAEEIQGEPGGLPDPVALPASRFGFMKQGSRERISFSSIVSNAGEAPIVLFGKRRERQSGQMPGWQYTKDANGRVQRRPTANGFVWDERDTHFHWHYNKLAVYELLDLQGNVVRRSDKIGFCFMPTTLLRFLPLPGPRGSGAPSFYEGGLPIDCGRRRSRRVSMSLPPGWGDEYYQGVAGQSLDVTTLPAGSYRLRITVNPTGDLLESDAGNNVSERLITLDGKGAGRSLTVPRQGIVSPEFHPLAKPDFRVPAGASGASVSGAGATGLPASAPQMFCGLRGI